MDTLVKRSRFVDYEPTGTTVVLSAHDLAIFDLLQEYRYLPTTYIAALTQRSVTAIQHRLLVLRKEGGYLECPRASWAAANARYRPAVYALTKKAEDVLKQRGLYRNLPKTSEPFAHELGHCLVRASFAIGVRAHNLGLITADDMLEHADCPPATRTSKTPFKIPYNGSSYIHHDGRPFGIKGSKRFFFPGIEFDRATEPLTPRDYDRSSIRRHIECIATLHQRGGYKQHYGIHSAIVPFVTISEPRKKSIMRVVEEIVGSTKIFLFKSVPDFSSFENFPPATGWALEEPWQRVGYDPLNICAELGVVKSEQ